jgi:hypothetical protein
MEAEGKLSSGGRLILPVSCFTYYSTVKMEAICPSETSDCLRTIRRYNREDRSEGLKRRVVRSPAQVIQRDSNPDLP